MSTLPWLPNRLHRVFEHIDAALGEPVTLDTLASIACLTPNYLDRYFGEHVGVTPLEYARTRRLNHMANRLRHEAESAIGELAVDCGFSNYRPFAKSFQHAYGMSAGEWRHEYGWRDFMHNTIAHNDAIYRQSGLALPAAPFSALPTANLRALSVAQIKIRVLPRRQVISRRILGVWTYDTMDAVTEAFMCESMASAIYTRGSRFIGIFKDDPGIVDCRQFCYETCMTEPTGPLDGLNVGQLPGGHYACMPYFDGTPLFQWLYEEWLEQQTDWLLDSSRPHMRCYIHRPQARGWMAIPIKRRRLRAKS